MERTNSPVKIRVVVTHVSMLLIKSNMHITILLKCDEQCTLHSGTSLCISGTLLVLFKLSNINKFFKSFVQ